MYFHFGGILKQSVFWRQCCWPLGYLYKAGWRRCFDLRQLIRQLGRDLAPMQIRKRSSCYHEEENSILLLTKYFDKIEIS